ncbi:MAG: UvrD-helicase domain-containing protein [Bacteroidia bacterium]|jgi:DNA helicase-2/ATP-dependent DNA helicase PcrA|nr:UvrD-helicase domain-containing protein [Bacteroidia bacterium]
MQNYLDQLNEVQREAVIQTEGPVMIIAGAGSGKTRVLTYRIAHLIEKGTDPFNILSLTFTNKAAREMKERISKVVGNEARNLWMGTFHSVFARILRMEADKINYPSNFTIYDTDDSKSLIRDILKEQNLDDKIYKPSVVLNRISSAKNNLFNWMEYQGSTELVSDDNSTGKPKMGMIFEMYSKRCFKAGAMDFDDILYNTWKLFHEHPEVLYKYQLKFKYVMVDEFQDTNFAQYIIVKKLSAMHQNICVVGDDAQSIYAFRGANIQNILNFEKDFSELKTFKLEQNYRSTKNIVKAANSVITYNKNQLKKDVWTDNHSGEKIKVLKALSDNEEGNQVALSIFEEKMNRRLRNKDFAILYRTNAQSRSMEEALRRQNIPYRVFGGVSFYNRKEIKDLLAYFRMAINNVDEEAMKRIINYPARGIGKTTVDRIVVHAAQENVSTWQVIENIHEFKAGINGGIRDKIAEFGTMVKSWNIMLKNHTAYELASHIANASGLLHELYNDRTPEGVSHYENVQELLNGIREFSENGKIPLESPSAEQDLPTLRTLDLYMQDIALLTDADNDKDGDTDKVALMTIHSAKGLEFKNVYVVGLEENLFPSQLSVNSRTELEEERRLFYVAITRAEEKLTLSMAATRYRWGNLIYCTPSRFLEEVDPDCLEMPVEKAPGGFLDDDDERGGWGNSFGGGGQRNFQRGQGKPGGTSKTYQGGNSKTTRPQSSPARPATTNGGAVPQGFKKLSNALPVQAAADFEAADPSQITVGLNVEHQRFGRGQVIAIEGRSPENKATILFETQGQKQLLLKFAKLKIV